MSRITTSCVIVMLFGSFAMGEVGDLTFMKTPPPSNARRPLFVRGFKQVGTDEAKGLVNPRAAVGELSGGTRSVKMKVAVDSADADATKLDLIRLDFSAKGMFKGAPTVAIKMGPAQRGGGYMGVIAPVVVNVKRDGKTVSSLISGNYWEYKNQKGLSLMMSVAVEGECKFGDKTYPVRVIDENANLKFSDAMKLSDRLRDGDSVLIDTGGDKFASATPTYIGQPALADGAWYVMNVTGMKITATRLKAAEGSVKVNAPRWNCVLTGKKYFLSLSGTKAPMSVPADDYRINEYTVFAKNTPGKRCATISGRGGKVFTVSSGETVDLAIGEPLTVGVVASKRRGKVRINMVLKDALGGKIRGMTNNVGRRMPAPSVEVVNNTGKIIYTAKLAYG
ncbi:MAG: hypothetical protein GY794_03025 [bacterium]|nr:hypothetical protein [bacterium]